LCCVEGGRGCGAGTRVWGGKKERKKRGGETTWSRSSFALLRGLLLQRSIATNDRDSLFSCHRFMRRSVWSSNFSNVYLLLESVSGIEPMSAGPMNLRSNHQSRGDHPPQHDREKKRGSGLSCRKPESEPRLQAPNPHCSAPAVCVAFIAFCRLGCRVLNIRENVYLLL